MTHWDLQKISILPVQAFLTLYKTNTALVRHLEEKIRPLGLTLGRLCLLVSLRNFNKPMLPSELGDDLAVTRSNISGLLRALESLGMVRREMDPNDRRRVLVHLTAHGEETLNRAWPIYVKAISESFQPLTTEEQSTLFQLLQKLDNCKG